MASGYSPWWRRQLYKIPGLFKKCPGGNYHWFWDRLCFCSIGESFSTSDVPSGSWHGGIWDFKLKREYHDCSKCREERFKAR